MSTDSYISVYRVEVVCLDCRKVLKVERRPMSFRDAIELAETLEHGHEGHALNRKIQEEMLD